MNTVNSGSFSKASILKKNPRNVIRYRQKNSELKCMHGYDVASSSGLIGMEIQGATAIFVVNLKRIIKLFG